MSKARDGKPNPAKAAPDPDGSQTPGTARRVALVTGGARRVGRAVALRLAEAGLDVAITYRDSKDDAHAVVKELEALGAAAAAIHCDLADPGVAERVEEQLGLHFDRLDVLVHNAAIYSATPIGEITASTFDRFQAVNARGPLLLTQKLAPHLVRHYDREKRASAGRVIHLVDTHVMGQPTPRHAAYNASKAALLELTRSLAVELAPGITVNAVAPGVVAWEDSADEADRAAYLSRVPLARAGTPDDAAEVVRFLACEAHYTTGQVIRVDGGRLLA